MQGHLLKNQGHCVHLTPKILQTLVLPILSCPVLFYMLKEDRMAKIEPVKTSKAQIVNYEDRSNYLYMKTCISN